MVAKAVPANAAGLARGRTRGGGGPAGGRGGRRSRWTAQEAQAAALSPPDDTWRRRTR
jgi:hypothetical protein